jgi:enamine deaminase RidA (YjgF/YER057c/UK114 family)
MAGGIEERLAGMGLALPPSREWASPNRTGAVQIGKLIFVSGHTPPENFRDYRKYGKVGDDMSLDDARHAAEGCALAMLRSIIDHVCPLDNVVRVGKLLGFVNSASGFQQHFAVIDGASNVFHGLWEEAGVHARSAVGVFELPRGQCVEVEGIFEVC